MYSNNYTEGVDKVSISRVFLWVEATPPLWPVRHGWSMCIQWGWLGWVNRVQVIVPGFCETDKVQVIVHYEVIWVLCCWESKWRGKWIDTNIWYLFIKKKKISNPYSSYKIYTCWFLLVTWDVLCCACVQVCVECTVKASPNFSPEKMHTMEITLTIRQLPQDIGTELNVTIYSAPDGSKGQVQSF